MLACRLVPHERVAVTMPLRQNPRGRPRREEGFAEFIRKELNQRIWVQENGRRIRITKREAWLRRIVNGAIKLKPRAQRTFIKIARPAENWLGLAG